MRKWIVLLVVTALIGGCIYTCHRSDVTERQWEVSLSESDVAHIQKIREALPTLKRGDLILFRSGEVMMVHRPYEQGDGYIRVNLYNGTLHASREVYVSPRNLLEMDRVIRRGDSEWAKTAQKLLRLED